MMNPQTVPEIPRRPTVAVLGASTDRTKYGNKSVRAHLKMGYEVYPVNPNAASVEGLRAYPTLADLPPGHLNRVTVYLPPPLTLRMLDAIALVRPDEVWLNPGTENEEVLAKATALGLPIITACSILDVGSHPSEFAEQ